MKAREMVERLRVLAVKGDTEANEVADALERLCDPDCTREMLIELNSVFSRAWRIYHR